MHAFARANKINPDGRPASDAIFVYATLANISIPVSSTLVPNLAQNTYAPAGLQQNHKVYWAIVPII